MTKTDAHFQRRACLCAALLVSCFSFCEAYDYDANGNRKKFENSANNQLTSDGEFRYTYDDEGNRIEKKSLKSADVTKYVWDHRNRLVQVKTSKEAVNYVYDFRNRLVKRNDEFFIHDEWQIVASLKNNKVTHRYLWGANQDELLSADDAWTLGDHLNSIRDIIDNAGKVVAHREYNAFGKVTKATGKFDCIFGYTGKMLDAVTGLQWNINRWYDAEVGRWCSEDPIGFKGKDTNLYRYVGNCCITSSDYRGFFTNKFKWLGFHTTNHFSIEYEGEPYTFNMNASQPNIVGNGPGVWWIGVCIWDKYEVLSEVQDGHPCWVPSFIVKGFVAVVIRPDDEEVVDDTTNFTNRDVWEARRSSSGTHDITETLGSYKFAVNNHEGKHYTAALETMYIIFAGITAAEYRAHHGFDTKAKAEAYSNKVIAEANRIYKLGRDHSNKFDTDTDWANYSFSLLTDYGYSFEKEFIVPECDS